eukprot:scaffold9212_cov59-Phaeocystis_antarctica.AAC.3
MFVVGQSRTYNALRRYQGALAGAPPPPSRAPAPAAPARGSTPLVRVYVRSKGGRGVDCRVLAQDTFQHTPREIDFEIAPRSSLAPRSKVWDNDSQLEHNDTLLANSAPLAELQNWSTLDGQGSYGSEITQKRDRVFVLFAVGPPASLSRGVLESDACGGRRAAGAESVPDSRARSLARPLLGDGRADDAPLREQLGDGLADKRPREQNRCGLDMAGLRSPIG